MALKYMIGGVIRGLSTDTKPTTIPANTLFFETDTGKTLYWNSNISEWIEQTDEKRWQVLGVAVLYVAGDNIFVQNLKPRKYLRLLLWKIASGNSRVKITFNGDTGTNYARRDSSNGAADGTSTSDDGIALQALEINSEFLINDITNLKGQEKLLTSHSVGRGTAGAGNAPDRKEVVAKWSNTTTKINKINSQNVGSGDYAVGTTLIVLGKD